MKHYLIELFFILGGLAILVLHFTIGYDGTGWIWLFIGYISGNIIRLRMLCRKMNDLQKLLEDME